MTDIEKPALLLKMASSAVRRGELLAALDLYKQFAEAHPGLEHIVRLNIDMLNKKILTHISEREDINSKKAPSSITKSIDQGKGETYLTDHETESFNSQSHKRPTENNDETLETEYEFLKEIARMANLSRRRDCASLGSKRQRELAPLVDYMYTVATHNDLARSKLYGAVEHYLKHGIKEKRRVRGQEDPQAIYDSLFRDPLLAKKGIDEAISHLCSAKQGLTSNVDIGPLDIGSPTFEKLSHVIGITPEEAASTRRKTLKDFRIRLMAGELGSVIQKAIDIEPLIAHSTKSILSAQINPIRSASVSQLMIALHKLHEEIRTKEAKIAVLIPWMHLSGATRIAAHLVSALSKLTGCSGVIVIQTEKSGNDFSTWFPSDVQIIDMAKERSNFSFSSEQSQILLLNFIRSLGIETIFNVNSRLFWDTLKTYSTQVSREFKIISYFFCNDKDRYGAWVGYPVRMFHRYWSSHHSIVCDSDYLASQLMERYQLTMECTLGKPSLRVLKTPVPVFGTKQVSLSAKSTKQVFWAGRFDRQKRIDLVQKIAEALPEYTFRLWGAPTLDSEYSLQDLPRNIILEGLYKDFLDLPLDQCMAWLYTSEWDGIPNMLIEVTAAGIPLVASVCGGTSEVMDERFCHMVYPIDSIDIYCNAIRQIDNNFSEWKERAQKLSAIVSARHSPDKFEDIVSKIIRSPALN